MIPVIVGSLVSVWYYVVARRRDRSGWLWGTIGGVVFTAGTLLVALWLIKGRGLGEDSVWVAVLASLAGLLASGVLLAFAPRRADEGDGAITGLQPGLFDGQTGAMLLDAYRELNARKMFWITLAISLVVVGVFACVGINERGITLINWQFDTSPLDSGLVPPDRFYKFVFSNLAVRVWLTWAATILALISTASLFPDFLAGGSIDLLLSKPIGRTRLFLTKYATGLLFVGLQVTVFSLACFVVIGVRGKAWEPRLLLAIPIVLIFFSYVWCVCALLGLLTRSTIASLLLTLLVWLGLYGLNKTDDFMLGQRESAILNAEKALRRVQQREVAAQRNLDDIRDRGDPVPGEDGEPLPPGAKDTLEAVSDALRLARKEAVEKEEAAAKWRRYSGYVTGVKTVLPKTSDTIELLDRWLLTPEDKAWLAPRREVSDDTDASLFRMDPELARRLEEATRNRPVWWVLGTSLAFEAVVLGVCVLIFARRDF